MPRDATSRKPTCWPNWRRGSAWRPPRFLSAFDSDEARARTQAHFRQARQAGVRGFPTLIMQRDAQLHPVSSGCQPLETVRAAVETCLAT